MIKMISSNLACKNAEKENVKFMKDLKSLSQWTILRIIKDLN